MMGIEPDDLELMDTVRSAEECRSAFAAVEILEVLSSQVRSSIEAKYIAAGCYADLLDALGELNS